MADKTLQEIVDLAESALASLGPKQHGLTLVSQIDFLTAEERTSILAGLQACDDQARALRDVRQQAKELQVSLQTLDATGFPTPPSVVLSNDVLAELVRDLGDIANGLSVFGPQLEAVAGTITVSPVARQ